MMPNELAFEFCQLDVGVVQLSGDLRTPVVAEQIELLRDIHLFHEMPPSIRAAPEAAELHW
jgi:hypothetical protein